LSRCAAVLGRGSAFFARAPRTNFGVDQSEGADQGRAKQVRADVRRRLADFMPGGGFVFNTVHNIQGNVPSKNLVAMWETVREYGRYA